MSLRFVQDNSSAVASPEQGVMSLGVKTKVMFPFFGCQACAVAILLCCLFSVLF